MNSCTGSTANLLQGANKEIFPMELYLISIGRFSLFKTAGFNRTFSIVQLPLISYTFNFEALRPSINSPKCLFNNEPKNYSKTILD